MMLHRHSSWHLDHAAITGLQVDADMHTGLAMALV